MDESFLEITKKLYLDIKHLKVTHVRSKFSAAFTFKMFQNDFEELGLFQKSPKCYVCMCLVRITQTEGYYYIP